MPRSFQWQRVMNIKSSEIFKDVVVLSGKCSNCKTHYFADHENYPQVGGHRRRVYLNNAKYLKLGKSLYVDRLFSNAVVNGTYSFHASVAAYAEFWTNTYEKEGSLTIERRQIWQAFVHETVRTMLKLQGSCLKQMTIHQLMISLMMHSLFLVTVVL